MKLSNGYWVSLFVFLLSVQFSCKHSMKQNVDVSTTSHVASVNKKVCCLCTFWQPRKPCTDLSYEECQNTDDCRIEEIGSYWECNNSRILSCNKWLKETKGCDEKFMFKDEAITKEGGRLKIEPGFTDEILPKDCTEWKLEEFAHANPQIGCERMNKKIRLCLDVSPKCERIEFQSSGCQVFKEKSLADAYVYKLKEDFPGVQMELIGNQTYGGFDCETGETKITGHMTYHVSCEGDITTSYAKCSASTETVCRPAMMGQAKFCIDDNNRLARKECCCPLGGLYDCSWENSCD